MRLNVRCLSGDMTNDFEGIFIELMRSLDHVGQFVLEVRFCFRN